MTQITRSVLINAPKPAVWAALADFGNVARLSPNIKNSCLTSRNPVGVGSTRHCDLAMMGVTLEERITEWKENECLAVDIYQWTNMPVITKMGARFLLSTAEEKTRLTATMEYTLGLWPIGWLMDIVMMRRMNAKNWATFVGGIRMNVETGVHIDRDTVIDLNGVVVA